MKRVLRRLAKTNPVAAKERDLQRGSSDPPSSEEEQLSDAAEFLPDVSVVMAENFCNHMRRPVLELLQLYHVHCHDKRGPVHKTPLPFEIRERIERRLEKEQKTRTFLEAREAFRAYRKSMKESDLFASFEEREACAIVAQSLISAKYKLDDSAAALLDFDVLPLELSEFYEPPWRSLTARLLQSSPRNPSHERWNAEPSAAKAAGEWLLGVPTENVRRGYLSGAKW